MISKNLLFFTARFFGFYLAYFMSVGIAHSQSETEQAITLLKLSLKCPLPVIATKDGYKTTRKLTTKDFVGDASNLVVTGKSIVRTSDPEHDTVNSDERNFSISAPFFDLNSVYAKDKSVQFFCRGGCIQVKETSSTGTVTTNTRGDYTLLLCDQDAADDAKMVLQDLITSARAPVEVQTNIAPSFVCSGPTSAAEIAICDNPRLAELDRKLDTVFKSAKDRLSGARQKELISAQRAWLNRRDFDCFGSDSCLRSAYEKRIAELGTTSSDPNQTNNPPTKRKTEDSGFVGLVPLSLPRTK